MVAFRVTDENIRHGEPMPSEARPWSQRIIPAQRTLKQFEMMDIPLGIADGGWNCKSNKNKYLYELCKSFITWNGSSTYHTRAHRNDSRKIRRPLFKSSMGPREAFRAAKNS
jgi:hypothetical protein